MKVILRPRRTGRTEEIIRLCAEAEARGEVSYIICLNHVEAYRIAQEAKKLDLFISFPITSREFLNAEYSSKNIKNFFIDNADHLLQSMTAVPIQAVTVEQTVTECICAHCSATVDIIDWTHPYCPQCYANPKCK